MATREKKGFSRSELAQKAGITTQFLSYIESGQRGLSSYTIINLSFALNVTTDYILLGQADMEHRRDYASQAFANLSEAEQENSLKLMNAVAEIFRGYK